MPPVSVSQTRPATASRKRRASAPRTHGREPLWFPAASSALLADGGSGVAAYGRVMTTIAPVPLAVVEAQTVMSAGLVACPLGAALSEVAALTVVHQVHAVLVDPGGQRQRLVTARNVVRAALAGESAVDGESLSEPLLVAPEETLLSAAERMVAAGEGHVVVSNRDDGAVRGVLSSFDVAAVLAGHDPRIARIVRQTPRCWPRCRLTARPVRDVMHRGVITCASTAPLAEVARVFVERRIHAVMVRREEGRAFVTDLDLVAGALQGGTLPTAGEVAGPALAAVAADATLDLAASLVAETAGGHVVVMEADGFPVGVISALDVVEAIGPQ